MKYIKTYEDSKVIFTRKSAWTIYGDVIKVLNHIDMQDFKWIIKSLKERTESYIGIILFKKNTATSYIMFDSMEVKDKVLDDYPEYKFKGELRLENGELVLDTLEMDIKKYNI